MIRHCPKENVVFPLRPSLNQPIRNQSNDLILFFLFQKIYFAANQAEDAISLSLIWSATLNLIY